MTHELNHKIQTEGLDIILNAPSNVDAMGRLMTLPNGGIVPSRSASFRLPVVSSDEVIL